MEILNYAIKGIIPIIVGAVVLYGILHGVKVYECFIEGAKEGIGVCMRILPYLLAMLIAIKDVYKRQYPTTLRLVLTYFIFLFEDFLNPYKFLIIVLYSIRYRRKDGIK